MQIRPSRNGRLRRPARQALRREPTFHNLDVGRSPHGPDLGHNPPDPLPRRSRPARCGSHESHRPSARASLSHADVAGDVRAGPEDFSGRTGDPTNRAPVRDNRGPSSTSTCEKPYAHAAIATALMCPGRPDPRWSAVPKATENEASPVHADSLGDTPAADLRQGGRAATRDPRATNRAHGPTALLVLQPDFGGRGSACRFGRGRRMRSCLVGGR
jgi:hypothetical protein